MSDRPIANLFPEQVPGPDEEELRRQARRRRYAERLGDNSFIELQSLTPDDSEEWRQIGELRRKVYIDERNYLPADAADENGREYDEYDESSDTFHIYAKDELGKVVGYARILTKGESGHVPLPAEKAFNVALDERTVEISRLISDREFPGGPLVTLSLIRALKYELESSEKYGAAIATLEPFLALHLDNMGVPIKTLVDIQETPEYNSSNMLVEMDYEQITERAGQLDAVRRFSPVYPERLGLWFGDKKNERGLGRIALIDAGRSAA